VQTDSTTTFEATHPQYCRGAGLALTVSWVVEAVTAELMLVLLKPLA
jgi:hypothetical protein